MKESGILFVVSAPSGSGKGTILRKVSLIQKDMVVSVSATTRKPREGEKDGVDYYFLDKQLFLSKVKCGEMLEYNEHFGNYYGTIKSEVDELLKSHEVVVLEVDVNGASSITKIFDCVKIFIVPPNFQVLKNRLLSRKTENLQSLNERLCRTCFETKKAVNYDYVIVNDDVEEAVKNFNSIVEAEKRRVFRNLEFLDGFSSLEFCENEQN